MQNSQHMKRPLSSTLAGCLIGLSLALSGCKADVDLKNIDPGAGLNMGLAMPVGALNVTLADMLGNGKVEHLYIDSLNEKGVLVYKDTFRIDRKFHHIDLSQYVSSTSLTMNVYDQLKDMPCMNNHKVTGNSLMPIRLDFPFSLHLEGLNSDTDNERLDSALIQNAKFVSNISNQNLPLQWEWIDAISIELGSEFSRPQGNVLTIYRRGDQQGYNSDIPMMVDEFSLNLMKDLHPTDYHHNVKSECNLTIHFDFTIPTEAGEVYIPDDAAFNYNLQVQFIDYYALWGMFAPSNEMYDADVVSLEETWNSWPLFRDARLPFADPHIDMYITTQIAGAMSMQGDYLYVKENTTGTKIHATFNGDTTLHKHFAAGEYLPLSSAIGDSATVCVRFDKDPARGHIDQLFSIRPDQLGYKFLVDFDQDVTPQIRLTNNTAVRVDAAYALPFVFNQNVSIHYVDTLENINLSNLTLDSLLASSERVDSVTTNDLKLLIKLQNTMPLQLKVVLRCLDADGNIVPAADDPTRPLQLTTSDTLLIPAPSYTLAGEAWTMNAAGELASIISVNANDFASLDKVKKLRIEALLDDSALQYAYEQGHFNVQLTADQKLRICIGIAANVDAAINMGNTTTQQGEDMQ